MTLLSKFHRIKARIVNRIPFVIDAKTDHLLTQMGSEARKFYNKASPEESRKRILLFPSYQHSKFVALHDATMTLALTARGADVLPVLSGFFYEKEDVIFGGTFNDNRAEKQFGYSRDENTLFSSLLNLECVSLRGVSPKEFNSEAKTLLNSLSYNSRKQVTYKGYKIGEMCDKIVSNLNNIPAMEDTKDHLRQYEDHIRNCIRLVDACENLIRVYRPDVIVSNVPFYYKWEIPFLVAQKEGIPVYSSMASERKNCFFWSRNETKLFDASPCWESYYASSFADKYLDAINSAIEDRVHGRISHISFLPAKNEKHNKLSSIKERLNGRPCVLFPVNVLVDAAVLVPTQAFETCVEMIKDVVEFFRSHPQYVCLMKAHPAEKLWDDMGGDVQSMHLARVLKKLGLDLPENVIFIDYNESFSSFNLFSLVQGLIAYSSSTCMEVAWFGKRVISAHPTHYSCAGFVHIPSSKDDFFKELTSILTADVAGLSKDEIERRSRHYYFLYYFISQIDLKLLQGNDLGTVPANLYYSSIDALLPGQNTTLDYLCDAILNNKPIFAENRWPPVSL